MRWHRSSFGQQKSRWSPQEMLDATGFAEGPRSSASARISSPGVGHGGPLLAGHDRQADPGGGGSPAAEARTLPPHSARERSTRRAALPTCACTSSPPRSAVPFLPARGPESSPRGRDLSRAARLAANFVVTVLPSARHQEGFNSRRTGALRHAFRRSRLRERACQPARHTPASRWAWRNLQRPDLLAARGKPWREAAAGFRADVTEAAVYGLFRDSDTAEEAARVVRPFGHICGWLKLLRHMATNWPAPAPLA